MRFQFSKSWDFNQMLVASVFGHFMFMTLVLFIPQTVIRETVIRPALMVQLVENPTGQKKTARKKPVVKKPNPPKPVKKVQAEPPPKPPAPEKPAAKPRFQPKEVAPISKSIEFDPLPPTVPADPGRAQEILDQLNQLDGKQPPGLIEKLEEVARLEAKTPPKPTPPPVKKTPPPEDKPFKEADVVERKPPDPLEKTELAVPIEDPLDDFEQLKMQSEPDIKPLNEKIKNETPKNEVNSLRELEFAALERPDLEYEKKNNDQSASDLLKELAALEKLKAPVAPSPEIPQETQEAPLNNGGDAKDFELILKKLDSLEEGKKEVQIDVANQKTLAMEFKSDLWKVRVPEAETLEIPQEAAVEGGTPTEGEPNADILAQYIGLVRQKVYKKWYEPLGQKYNKEVVLSFYIYPGGNIDRPHVNSSSGVDLLDTLAVRAVKEAEPFPEFPDELKYSNLNITIHFKYVPEN